MDLLLGTAYGPVIGSGGAAPPVVPDVVPDNDLLYDAFEIASNATVVGRAIGQTTWVAHSLNSGANPNVLSASNSLDLNAGTNIVLCDATGCGADVSAFASLTESTWASMLLARFSATARTGYSGRYLTSGGKYELGRWDAGSYTIIAQASASAPSAGAVFELRCEGNDISLLVNGSQVVAVTDATYTSAGFAGVRCGGNAGSTANAFWAVPFNAESADSVANIATDSWDRESTTYIQTQNTGDHCQIRFGGDYLALDMQNPSGITGYLAITFDDETYQRIDLLGGTYTQPVFYNPASEETKTIKVILAGNNSITDNWGAPPTNAVRITGVRKSSNGAYLSVTQKPKRYVVVGDSISRGRAVARTAADNLGWAPGAWPYLLSLLESADMDFIAFSGQGFGAAGAGNEPAAKTAVSLYSTGRTRASRSNVSKVLVAHGTNDSTAADGTLAADATTTWNAIRTLYPNAKIYAVIPLGYAGNTGSPSAVEFRDARNLVISDAFAAWGDSNKQLIDLTSEVYGDSLLGPFNGGSNAYTADLLHPNASTNELIASAVRDQL